MDEPVKDPHSAEYEGLLAGLAFARRKNIQYIGVFSDSQTLVNQITREWKTREHLADYRERARGALDQFVAWQVSWVPREWNKEADALVDSALGSVNVSAEVDRPE